MLVAVSFWPQGRLISMASYVLICLALNSHETESKRDMLGRRTNLRVTDYTVRTSETAINQAARERVITAGKKKSIHITIVTNRNKTNEN